MICSPAYVWLCALLAALGADGCTVSTLELEHSLRSDGDVAVLNGRELRQVPPRQGCRLERGFHDAQPRPSMVNSTATCTTRTLPLV